MTDTTTPTAQPDELDAIRARADARKIWMIVWNPSESRYYLQHLEPQCGDFFTTEQEANNYFKAHELTAEYHVVGYVPDTDSRRLLKLLDEQGEEVDRYRGTNLIEEEIFEELDQLRRELAEAKNLIPMPNPTPLTDLALPALERKLREKQGWFAIFIDEDSSLFLICDPQGRKESSRLYKSKKEALAHLPTFTDTEYLSLLDGLPEDVVFETIFDFDGDGKSTMVVRDERRRLFSSLITFKFEKRSEAFKRAIAIAVLEDKTNGV